MDAVTGLAAIDWYATALILGYMVGLAYRVTD